jgi:hypothetical protein
MNGRGKKNVPHSGPGVAQSPTPIVRDGIDDMPANQKSNQGFPDAAVRFS